MANRLILIALLGLIACKDGLCQQTAYLSLDGNTLSNHSHVDLREVGSDANGADSIQCRTDLDSCCGTDAAGSGGGNWFTPGNASLEGDAGAVYAVRGRKRVDLRRRNSNGVVSGIYRCEIDTVAIGAGARERETLYVGLYENGGGQLQMESGVSLSVSGGSTTRFTLTCITTGGPATSVTWTRGSGLANNGKRTVLDDQLTARYIHTLTVTGRLASSYHCIVVNDVSRVDATFVQDEVVSVLVVSTTATTATISWSIDEGVTPSSLSISYSNTNNTQCFTHSEEITGIPAGQTSHTLRNLKSGTQYSVRVTAVLTSSVTFSKSLTITTKLIAPSAAPPPVVVTDSTPSTLSLQWGPVDCGHTNGELTGYRVSYETEDGSEGEKTVTVTGTTATLSGLMSSTGYIVSVAAINTAGVGPHTENLVAQTTAFDESSLSLVVESLSPTSATISWTLTVPSLSASSYSLSYSNTQRTHCFTDSKNISGLVETRLTLTGLREGTEYSVSLTAALSNGENLQRWMQFTTHETVPDAPPGRVGVSDVSSTSITIQWGPLDCTHHNGEIVGYSVRYQEEGSKTEGRVMVSGGLTQQAVVSELVPGRLYSLSVAAVNGAGEGAYSDPVRAATLPVNSPEAATGTTSTASSSSSCTEALVMTGCIGVIVGVIATLLVSLPTFFLLCRRKPKTISSDAAFEEEKNNEDLVLSENSAYASVTSTAANSYQDVVIYEHVR